MMPLQQSAAAPGAAQGSLTHQRGVERRRAKREPGKSGGAICGDGIWVPVSCVVTDISTTGARLTLNDSAEGNVLGTRAKIPNNFTLALRTDRVEVDCAIVWRHLGVMGVRFHSQMRPITKKSR